MSIVDRFRTNVRLRGLCDAVLFGLFAKGIGFAVPIVIAAEFGVTRGTDGFFLALAISTTLTAIWGQSVEQFCVPLFAEVYGQRVSGRRGRWLARRAVAGAFVMSMIAAAGLWLYLRVFSAVVDGRVTLACFFLLIPQVIASAWGAVQSSYLIARSQFRWSAGSVALRAIGVLLSVLLAQRFVGVFALAFGWTLGEFLRSSVLAVVASRWRSREQESRGSPVPHDDVLGRAGHQLGAMALNGIAPMAERSIAATIGLGAISRLEYATKLFYLPSVVFDTNFVSVFLAEWSRHHATDRLVDLHRDVWRVVRLVFVTAVAVALGTVMFRIPLVRIALARGAFPMNEAAPIGNLLGVLILALPFSAAAMLLSGAYVAMAENRFLLRVCTMKVIVRVGAAIALSRWFGLSGIAAAFAVSQTLEFAVLALRFRSISRRRVSRGRAFELSLNTEFADGL